MADRRNKSRAAKTAGEEKRRVEPPKKAPAAASAVKPKPKSKAKARIMTKAKPSPKAAGKSKKKETEAKDTSRKSLAKTGGKKDTTTTVSAVAPKDSKSTRGAPKKRNLPPPTPGKPTGRKRKRDEHEEPVEAEPLVKKRGNNGSAIANTSQGSKSAQCSPKKSASTSSPKKDDSVASQLSQAGSEVVEKTKSTVNSVANTVAAATSPRKSNGSKSSALSSAPSNISEK
ncbi:hypothetical protein DOTSEDRAFT_25922 [Dothistroma septosporum NZE10]|uniref:Uncharacterized protein n=1 Tax=Dothistroma septosporum (strain NZE10 / CBS 128990) TaxID=675120 RepID=N1PI65_DOTSN|nr:hypothetical protein DOTSEDRAFT_25922 [Dothistroma septosporum NZE10]